MKQIAITPATISLRVNRYLAITNWATDRYTKDGYLVLSRGLVPSRYSLIEQLAAERYLGCAPRAARIAA